jgi:hypothetical protein
MREKDLGMTREQLEAEAREMLRKKYLTKELASIQRKAAKEAAEQRESEVIARGLEERRLREEEEKRQRLVREREEQEEEERELQEKVEMELREKEAEKEARELAEQERDRRFKEERERAEKEALEREAREQEQKERMAREKVEQERREKEAKEREEQEVRARELQLQAEQKREAERLLEEERRRKEQERQAKLEQERQAKLAAEAEELRKKEEAEKQRLELERLEKKRRADEADRKRKAQEEEAKRQAHELQQQIAQEQEARRLEDESARIESLPHTLRLQALGQLPGSLAENFRHFVPFFATTFPAESRASGSRTPNGISHPQEKWVYNIQAALALDTSDLTLSAFPLTERRPATEHEHIRMWNMLNPMLIENVRDSKKTLLEQVKSRSQEKEKYIKMQPGFWIKVNTPLPPFSQTNAD